MRYEFRNLGYLAKVHDKDLSKNHRQHAIIWVTQSRIECDLEKALVELQLFNLFLLPSLNTVHVTVAGVCNAKNEYSYKQRYRRKRRVNKVRS